MQSMEQEGVLDDIEHPNRDEYGHQRIFIVRHFDYVYIVPYVEENGDVFLKTIIPSRKMTKKYLKGGIS